MFQDDTTVYAVVGIGWQGRNGYTEVKLHDTTLSRAYQTAVDLGLKPTKWYQPSTWFQDMFVYKVEHLTS